jgi:hypothetical protein
MSSHEFLGEDLAPFKTRIPPRGSHQPHLATLEFVTNPRDQRTLRPHHGQVGFQALRQRHQGIHIIDVYGRAFGDVFRGVFVNSRSAAVARRAPDFFHRGRLAQPPNQRVLPPSASYHKDFHSKATIVAGPATVNPGTQIAGSGPVPENPV